MTTIISGNEEQIFLATDKVQLLGPTTFDVDRAVTSICGMQQLALDNYEKFEVGGRNATIQLMADVYAVWHEAKCSDQFESFISNIRQQLKDLDIKERSTSKPSSALIRFVFSKVKLTDKQVHVYGRALDVAYDKQTTPDSFAVLVKSTEGGFDGLREEGMSDAVKRRSPSVALSVCTAEPTVATSTDLAWPEGDDYQIVVAIRNDDDSTSFKSVPLSMEQRDALLLQFHASIKKRDAKPKAARPNKQVTAATASLTANVASNRSCVEQLELEISMAESANEPCEELKQKLFVQKLLLDGAVMQLESFQESVKV